MKTASHYAGLVLSVAPFACLLYKAARAGHLKYVLKGAAWTVAIIVWSAIVGYLLSH